MSTHCQIIAVEKNKLANRMETGREFVSYYGVSLYRHCDGYPEGVLPVLNDVVKRFWQERGDDPPYLMARVLQHLMQDHSPNGWLYYGVEAFDGSFHGDEEYIYVINQGDVEVRKTTGAFWDKPVLENTAIIGNSTKVS